MTPALALGARAVLGAAVGLAATPALAWWGQGMVGRPMPRRALGAVLAGGGAVSAALTGQSGWLVVVAIPLALALGLLAVVDAVSLRLPDALTLPLALAGLLSPTVGEADVASRLAGAGLGFASLGLLALIFRRTTGRSGLGLGDAKLFGAAGAWLGWAELPHVLLTACAIGFAWAAMRVLLEGLAALRRPIPFGPGLCVGLLTTWLVATHAGVGSG